jgi:pantoate kinase
MLERAEQQLTSLKQLLKTPTPENFEVASQQLSTLASSLQAFLSEATADKLREPRTVAFFRRLPSEMTHIHLLLETPVKFLEELASFRIQQFGSYDREGQMKGLGQECLAHTITQL